MLYNNFQIFQVLDLVDSSLISQVDLLSSGNGSSLVVNNKLSSLGKSDYLVQGLDP